ncbi:bactofilin family protein [Caulobacter soli]|uniref:bactofilin family protein n=1 Tax=Caulobacter soli TaxID=2708539 RepID=UPI0013ED111C|nr:polymer-forming cytoskeletal protein [Caulobacter soli]
MFAKKKDTAPAPAFTPLAMEPAPQAAQAPTPAPPPRPKPASMIAQGVAIKGDVMGDGEVHLDCVLQGDIRVGKLVLGPNARVEGALQAQVIEIHGRVTGTVCAKQVRLYGTAVVDGDITHEQLAMETGAQFQGRSLKFQRPVAAPVATPAPVPAAPAAHAPAMAVYPG